MALEFLGIAMTKTSVDLFLATFRAHDTSIIETDAALAAALPSRGVPGDVAAMDQCLARLEQLNRAAATLQRDLRAVEAEGAALSGLAARQAGFTPRKSAKLKTASRALRARRQTWAQIREAIQACRTVTPSPLFPPRDRRARALERANNATILALDGYSNGHQQSGEGAAYGCHSDITLKMNIFLSNLLAANRIMLAQARPRPWRFLDVGCGGGVKVMTAAPFFDSAIGLEYDPGYAKAATDLLDSTECNASITLGDALAFEDYGAFDVIYFYRPMRDADMARQMETRIVAQCRPGTLLIVPYFSTLSFIGDTSAQRVSGAVFITGTSADDAGMLAERAEMIGPDILCGSDRVPKTLSCWQETIQACRMAGYDPLLGPAPPVW